jgi:hypothetical protein
MYYLIIVDFDVVFFVASGIRYRLHNLPLVVVDVNNVATCILLTMQLRLSSAS